MYVTLDGLPYTATFKSTFDGFELLTLRDETAGMDMTDIPEDTRVFLEDAAYAAYLDLLDEKKSEYIN